MVTAWYMDDSDADQRLDHQRNPPAPIDLEQLEKLTGVLYWQINVEDVDNDPVLQKIRKDRGYTYKDEITCSPEKLPNYESRLKMFFEEHLHSDEEIRLVLEGSGFFDIRDLDDNWIRIKVVEGDLIVLPAGSYHRFTLDTNNYIKAQRLFVGEPVWTPINRPADDHPSRKEYLSRLLTASAVRVQ